ncbi:Crp/Fnr family transcriptional regulator [Luteimonas sp. RD2P54]|uniref:CRP-like protein Clp n=1 Tax=Luteimonas endophytica TaxID=3042023 RepID=A0ABT6JDE0_9GAMM|nr:Crp/Fnr family transcriptional regulator [Luteimonas endophytica]MDH5824830.1 Crp/Fnr family transcriptional regulator [Luteimonas endophytica]
MGAQAKPGRDIRPILENCALLRGSPAELLDHLLGHAHECRLGAGEILFFKNDPGEFLALVLGGQIFRVLYGPDGQELIVGAVEAGGTVDAAVLVDRQRHSFTAIARGPTRVLRLQRRHFPLLLADPVVAARAHAALCLDLRQAIDGLETMCLHRLESRLARHLLTCLQAQGGGCGSAGEIALPPTQGILAAMVNVSRPKLNAQLQRWHRSGLISRRRNMLRINDLELLRCKARLAPDPLPAANDAERSPMGAGAAARHA